MKIDRILAELAKSGYRRLRLEYLESSCMELPISL